MNWLLVFVGGGLGSLARYGMTFLWPPTKLAQGGMPWATLAANFLACLLLGGLLGYGGRDQLSRPLQLLLMTGFCGGFSTFSTFAAEASILGEEGFPGVAVAYVLLSLAAGMAALWLSLWFVR